MDELYREGRLAPNLSTWTLLGSTDEEVNYVRPMASDEYCTCVHGGEVVTSGDSANDNILIWCCGHYRSITEICVCAI